MLNIILDNKNYIKVTVRRLSQVISSDDSLQQISKVLCSTNSEQGGKYVQSWKPNFKTVCDVTV